MKIFPTFLKKEHKDELATRQRLIDQYRHVFQCLEITKEMWLRSLFPAYKLDPHKDYRIDAKTGRITEIKKDDLQSPKN